jgi:hypothetical protein
MYLQIILIISIGQRGNHADFQYEIIYLATLNKMPHDHETSRQLHLNIEVNK